MSELMKRREFITLLGGTAAWPIAAGAQTTALPRRIGVLLVGLSPESKEAKHFRLGLRDAGYSEGRNVVIEWRSANGDYGRVPEWCGGRLGYCTILLRGARSARRTYVLA
jgi:putative ABC transport system substrate-binding protein